MQPLSVEVEQYLPVVGMESLVGVLGKDYPLSFGNYCSISNGPYLVNMWSENLREWARRNPDEKIEVTVVSHGNSRVGIVTDKRLSDWCHDRMCVTGHGWPSVAALRKAGEIMGLPITDRFCGCEKDEEAPKLSQMWSQGKGSQIRCWLCGRQWEEQELGKEE